MTISGLRASQLPVGLARTGPRRARTHRLATAALLASTALITTAAHAADATWIGGNGGDPNEWIEPANWSPNNIPDGTATFTNNGAPTTV